jgi:Fe-S cluster biogenesis protein NfuA
MWEIICLDLVYGKNSMRRLVEEKVVVMVLCGRCGGSSSSYGGCNSLVTSMVLAIAMEVNSVFGSKTDKTNKRFKKYNKIML